MSVPREILERSLTWVSCIEVPALPVLRVAGTHDTMHLHYDASRLDVFECAGSLRGEIRQVDQDDQPYF